MTTKQRCSSPNEATSTNTSPRRRPRWSLIGIGIVALTPHALAAQLFLGFGGLEARGGLADTKQGGSNATFEADLGYAGVPALRTTLGIDLFQSNFDRVVGGERVTGSMKGAGGEAGVRYDFFPQRRFSFYAVGGVIAHSVRTTRDNPAQEDSLGGRHWGGQYGGGLNLRMGEGHFWSVAADVRRITETDIERTVFSIGLRYSVLGHHMYDPDGVPVLKSTNAPRSP